MTRWQMAGWCALAAPVAIALGVMLYLAPPRIDRPKRECTKAHLSTSVSLVPMGKTWLPVSRVVSVCDEWKPIAEVEP